MALQAKANRPAISKGCHGPLPRVVVARRLAVQRGSNVTTQAAAVAGDTADPIAVIKDCVAKTNAHPAPELLSAMLALEKAKVKPDGWEEILTDPRARWRLIFTADTKDVQAAQKKQPNKGGIYFPIPACQRFTASPADFANGVFLGPIASLTFDGPFTLSGRQMTFDHTRLNLGLGPWKFSFLLKKDAKDIKGMDDQSRKALPFFLYAYVDKDIIVGRGRGGGLAVWGRADAEWTVKTGIASVYK